MSYRQRVSLLVALDTCIVFLAVFFAYLLRFEFQLPNGYLRLILQVAGMHIIIVLIAFHFTKIYRRVWQYASVGELSSIVKAVLVSEVIVWIADIFIRLRIPKSIYVLSAILIILGVGGSRFAWRMFRDRVLSQQYANRRKLLIIGAGDAGVLVAKELIHSPRAELYPVAYIDDDKSKRGLQIMGIPVLGGRGKIKEVVENYEITDIVIAIPSASREEIAALIEICKETPASIKILPGVYDLLSGKITFTTMREVSVEDLLGREPVKLDLGEIAGYVTDKVVLVTGAGGSIGSELCRQVCRFGPKKLLLLGHGENSIYEIEYELRTLFPNIRVRPVIADVQDRSTINQVFAAFRPAVVFHAAAHKHVPLMEGNPAEAVKNNILGTKNVAEAANEYGATHFVMISTDKAVNPSNVMGATKRVAEMIVQGLNKQGKTKFVAVRFGNVLGSRGSVIPLFKRQIAEGGPVTVTHPEMIRYFMTIPEAVQLVIQAGALANGGEVFILDMGKPVRIFDLAKDLIRLSGYKPGVDIKITFTGIRPGEKLYEEMLTAEEGTSATRHNRIFVAKSGEVSWKNLMEMVAKLEHAAYLRNWKRQGVLIRLLLQKIVPGFTGLGETGNTEGLGIALSQIKEGYTQSAAGSTGTE